MRGEHALTLFLGFTTALGLATACGSGGTAAASAIGSAASSSAAGSSSGVGGASVTASASSTSGANSGSSSSGAPTSSSNASSTASSASSSSSSSGDGGTAPSGVRTWLVNGPGLEAEDVATSSAGVAFFATPTRRILYPIKFDQPPPSSWNVVWWRHYSNFTADSSVANSPQGFSYDVTHGLVQSIASTGAGPATIVAYDNETWDYTPTTEWSTNGGKTPDPPTIVKTMQAFATAAHEAGFKVMFQPAFDLMDGLVPGTYQDKYQAFIELEIARQVASYADYFHIQNQDLQEGPAASGLDYVTAAQAIIAQVHGVNPDVVITLGLTTNGTNASSDMVKAALAGEGIASGYWPNDVGGTGGSILNTALAMLPTPGP